MDIGTDIEKRGHVLGFQEELAKLAGSPEKFFAWFNNASTDDAAFVQGAWDFSCHIAPPLCGLTAKPDEATALEIGHGGGRILAAASRAFGRWMRYSFERNRDTWLWLVRVLEGFAMLSGYVELPARVNETNLRVTQRYARSVLQRQGLQCVGSHISYRGLPARRGRFGGQHGLSFTKPL